jgi:glutamine cyclotransferase
MKLRPAILLVLAAFPILGQSPAREPRGYTWKVLHAFPHDRTSFTEGLEYHDGFFYESTGLNGHSTVRKINPDTGAVLQQITLGPQYFGEGITIVKDKIIQLTYRNELGFVYRLSDFTTERQFTYSGEGWALTNNGQEIFMDDGSSTIRVLDPVTLREKRRIKVHDRGNEVTLLNELEFINGEIFANVWHTDRIARISPVTGNVNSWIDLTGLLSPMYKTDTEAVLNGIAWDAAGKRLFVTGKLWPNIFQIQLIPKSASR